MSYLQQWQPQHLEFLWINIQSVAIGRFSRPKTALEARLRPVDKNFLLQMHGEKFVERQLAVLGVWANVQDVWRIGFPDQNGMPRTN